MHVVINGNDVPQHYKQVKQNIQVLAVTKQYNVAVRANLV